MTKIAKNITIVTLAFTLIACTRTAPDNASTTTSSATQLPVPTVIATPSPRIKAATPIPSSKEITSLGHVFQTFNNCGPATYSMMLQYVGIEKTQKELGDFLRPYQISKGDNDDKSVSMEEIAVHAQSLGLKSYHRPNGTIDKLKQIIAAGYPVVLRTWLNDHEDIGHFIIIRGYNDQTQTIIFDDSYYNPNRTTTYQKLNELWQPFSYEYLALVKPDDAQKIENILGEETDQQKAWKNSLERNQAESVQNIYTKFNQSRANYYLGNYQETVDIYEEIQTQLSRRMLWYQYEPIQAYQKLGQHEKVIQLTNAILNNQNRAYSELYYIRAQSYLDQKDTASAKKELELAIKYNKNYEAAKDLLNQL